MMPLTELHATFHTFGSRKLSYSTNKIDSCQSTEYDDMNKMTETKESKFGVVMVSLIVGVFAYIITWHLFNILESYNDEEL